MRSPLESGPWQTLDEVESTQDVASTLLAQGQSVGVVFARHQSRGRGRFQREWVSSPGESLTMSLVFSAYADHPRPYLIGMAVACAAAGVAHCQLQWPNDLTMHGLKLGGILTELVPDNTGRKIPVVGVGINLNQTEFPPEISERAVSLFQIRGATSGGEAIARAVVDRVSRMPEPKGWTDLEPVWALFDVTPGKRYNLADGREAVALRVGPDGELLCAIDGESATVLAADAVFGPPA